MSIRFRIRQWLGITEIQEDQSMIVDRLGALSTVVHRIDSATTRTLGQVSTITPGLGRVISKLDPQCGRPEIDPARKAESDKLSDEVIKRLEAEAKAREPYNYDLGHGD